MNPGFIAFQMMGIVGSWLTFACGVQSAWALTPLALTMTYSSVRTFLQ